jgi:hypothetical protein
VIEATDPAHGVIEVRDDGSVIYTPEKNYKGTDTFTFRTSDGEAESEMATVTINVTASKPKGG